MKALFETMREDEAVRRTAECFRKVHGQSLLYGLSGAQKHAFFAAACDESPRPFVVLTYDREALEAWRENLSFLLPGRTVAELPAADVVTFQTAARSLELTAKRMDLLGRLLRGERKRICPPSRTDRRLSDGMSASLSPSKRLLYGYGDIIPRRSPSVNG